MSLPFEGIMSYFSKLSEVFADAEALFEAVFSLPISQLHYNTFREEYELQHNLYKKE